MPANQAGGYFLSKKDNKIILDTCVRPSFFVDQLLFIVHRHLRRSVVLYISMAASVCSLITPQSHSGVFMLKAIYQ